MTIRVTLEPAYILHRSPYRETSVLLNAFTKNYGRIHLVARGIRRKDKGLSGILQPFVPLYLSFSGRGELMTLIHAEIQGIVYYLTGKQLITGLYLNELLTHFIQVWDAYTELFCIYEKTLTGLQEKSLDEKIIRLFEKKLLEELGYGLFPRTESAISRAWQADAFYRFVATEGWVKSDWTNTTDLHLYSGKVLLAIAKEEWCDEKISQDAKRLMRQVLTDLMNAKPIYSRQLFVRLWETT
jgi:DNA repair protein RecO (recombination protein O)